MKRVLFITAFVPSRISAGENYSRQLINDISRENIVDLIFFKYNHDKDYIIDSKNVNVLRIFKNSGLIKLMNFFMFPFLFPLFTARFNLFRLLIIKKILKRTSYDKVIFDFSQTFLFARFLKNQQVILNSHDVIAQRYSRIYKGVFAPLARISERIVLNNRNAVIFTLSDKDSSLIRQYYSISSTVSDIYLEPEVVEARYKSAGDYFVFFANWKRNDNSNGLKWFIRFVLPELNFNSKFIIIGTGVSPEIIRELSVFKNISYMGFVENPYPVIADSIALISPLFSGAGVKIKVIESLACGTAVIGTPISFEGISDKYSRYLVKAENPAEFISAINDFKTDISEKTELKKQFLGSYCRKTIADYINRP
jgi:glycosyltransferase involved in cell wall biosynthesis